MRTNGYGLLKQGYWIYASNKAENGAMGGIN